MTREEALRETTEERGALMPVGEYLVCFLYVDPQDKKVAKVLGLTPIAWRGHNDDDDFERARQLPESEREAWLLAARLRGQV